MYTVFSNDAIVDEPISSQQPAMATKPAAPCPHRIHVWKTLNALQVLKNFVALCLGQFVKNFPTEAAQTIFHLTAFYS